MLNVEGLNVLCQIWAVGCLVGFVLVVIVSVHSWIGKGGKK